MAKKPPSLDKVPKQPLPDHEMYVRLPAELVSGLTRLSSQRGVGIEVLIRVALMNLAARHRYYELHSFLTFGKYSGEMMENIIRADPSYVRWMIVNMESINLSEGCLILLDAMERVGVPA